MKLLCIENPSATCRRTSITDQDVRKRLYEEQKNAIEQDMAPFGFMDDGMGDDNFVDDEGDRWFKCC